MSGETVLLVDDDDLFRNAATDYLARDALTLRCAPDLASARQQLDDQVALVVLDQRLPDGRGLPWIREMREEGHRARVLIVTAHPEVADAVAALRLGIDDYLTKPVDLETLRLSVLRSLETVRLSRVERLVRRERAREQGKRLVGAGLESARRLITLAATTPSPVLITGETGTGKSLAAAAIHYEGTGERPFVKVNCAAIPETLVEAELFGVERGAYTGAGKSREGLFELADGGTLFLDEIGELAPSVQAKLLGVLEDGAARRVGGTRHRRFSVRVVAATNVDVESAVEQGRLRRDLFFRLNVVRVDLPPLRQRLADLPDLVAALLDDTPGGRGSRLAPGEAERLAAYLWPGNVRELRNVLERSLLLSPKEALAPSRLLPVASDGGRPAAPAPAAEELASLKTVEMAHIQRVLAACDGNRTHAARVLGIGLATLRRRLNRSN